MATRSCVGIENADGTINSIYCHWDGYIEHNGKLLVENYTSEDKVRQLMALGDLSSLGSEIGKEHDFTDNSHRWCTAYGRDRGETNVSMKVHKNRAEYLTFNEEYNYLFCDGQWLVSTGKNFKQLLNPNPTME